MIFKLIYLTYRWDSNRYYHSVSGSGSNGNEGVLHSLPSSRAGTLPSDVV